MKCPQDGATLVMSERSGVEIDYCPECRGVWLDRGELDKIVERSARDIDESPRRDDRREERRDDRSDDRREHSNKPHYKKKKNWLGEIFEFGD